MTTAAPKSRRGISPPMLIILTALIAVVVLILAGRDPWHFLLINPLINALVFLNIVVLGEFGLAI
ncbi:MAG: hypothetical protein ABIP58_07365, partial [Dehalococcoidia bacterium]